MQAMNRYKFKSISTFIMAIINIIISIFLSKKWGAIGAALGTCISLVICNIILINIYYYKKIKLDIFKFWKSIIKQSIPFIIPMLLILLFMKCVKIDGIYSLIIYGGLYTILYSLTAYFLSMNEYEKNIINNFLIKTHIKKVE